MSNILTLFWKFSIFVGYFAAFLSPALGHVEVFFCLCVKTSLRVQNHSTENAFRLLVHLHANQSHFHIEGLALRSHFKLNKLNCSVFREETTSALGGFYAGPPSWSNWNLELVFMMGGKAENPEKNPRSKDENQQQTQPTYDTGPELNPGHTDGRRVLSLLRHPCILKQRHKLRLTWK